MTKRICSIDFCETKSRARGMCHKHYLAVYYRREHKSQPKTRPEYTHEGCLVDGCTWEGLKTQRRKGMCMKHYWRHKNGTNERIDSRQVVEADHVRGPQDLPIKPKAVAWHDEDGRARWAVMMPYPTFTSKPPCHGDPDSYDPDTWEGTQPPMAAVKACNTCPYRTACFEWAMAHESGGYWAGSTPTTRRSLRRMRGQIRVEPHTGNPTQGLFPDRDWSAALDREREAIAAPDPEEEEVLDDFEPMHE